MTVGNVSLTFTNLNFLTLPPLTGGPHIHAHTHTLKKGETLCVQRSMENYCVCVRGGCPRCPLCACVCVDACGDNSDSSIPECVCVCVWGMWACTCMHMCLCVCEPPTPVSWCHLRCMHAWISPWWCNPPYPSLGRPCWRVSAAKFESNRRRAEEFRWGWRQ